ncbi:hypothetical protein OEZ86_013496 [Tetradesmus obliquus]|nr:hypothetical protein OEZ86_013496 [Tetradesmus obliquus]
MSLLGLSASAVAGARAGNKRSADAAADEHQAAHASAVKLNLQQLAASVAACKATADQTSKEQHITDAVAAVQEGLRATQEQLARVLQQQQQRQQQATADAEVSGLQQGQVVTAWRLVVQHRCWYEFACHLLVQSSMAAAQQQQQQQRRRQQRQQAHMENMGGSSSSNMQLAGRAAAFIAWVQQPADTARRQQLQGRLLSPITTASRATADGAQTTSSSSSSSSFGSASTLTLICVAPSLMALSSECLC